jgi:BirA family biotin operon repressor/biotin-[acetyl-CoA-carboxylase] ligase
MQIAFEVIKILNDGKFHSGVQIAKSLRVSRTSIWKAIQYLEALGVSIDALRAKGYRLYQPLELLNKPMILSGLSKATLAEINRFEVLQSVPSTNDYLLAQIPYGLKSFSACVSEAQTSGKGRQGKIWQSPYGRNIYLSLYWQSSCILRGLSGLSLVLGMAILKALESLQVLPEGLGIKWPNDIYFQDKKLGGILIETQTDNKKAQTHVVMGIGLNVDIPKDKENQWSGLDAVLSGTVRRNQFCGLLLQHIIQAIKVFENKNFSAFHPDWTQYDLLNQNPVTISVGESEEEGFCLGVNERGELLVEVRNTLRALTYGDVSIRRSHAVAN